MDTSGPLLDLPEKLRTRMTAHLLTHSKQDNRTKCINYTGYKTPSGYGRFNIDLGGRKWHIRVHRAVRILTRGPIEDPTLVVDHLCANRACINPLHLDLITWLENLQRGDDRAGKRRRAMDGQRRGRAACVNGHAWPEFLRIESRKSGDYARCRECARLAQLDRRRAVAAKSSHKESASPVALW